MFEREDWTSFRTVEGLQQKAGVPQNKLRRLVLKELTDNALDTGASVRIGLLPDGGHFIEDKGGGIEGGPEEIARLFSINRPMLSTKLLRLPTRGALGNGLRGCRWRSPLIGGLSLCHDLQSADRTSP
jgi:hypothetical protein